MGDDREYLEARLDGLVARMHEHWRLSERAQDKLEKSLDYRLAAMDHERELLRQEVDGCASGVELRTLAERLAKLESWQGRIMGALALLVLVVGLLPVLVKVIVG